jgi:hypothetical protein
MPNPLEHLAAKAAGKAAGVGARARGLTGVFYRLAEQHQEAAMLLARAEAATEPAKRKDIWRTLRKELLAHEKGELLVVYPALDESAGNDIVHRHNEEARLLEATIKEVDAAGYDAPQWPDLLQRLTTLVKQHVDEEENEFFPRALEILGKDKADELEARFMAAREREMERL